MSQQNNKAGRKPVSSKVEKVGPDFVGQTPPAIAEKEATVNAAIASASAERDLLNQLLGQHQALMAVSQFSRTFGISKLAYIKENKIYRGLRGMQAPATHGENSGRPEFLSGTWEEFCQLIGRSVDQVDEDIKNLRAFGEAALESMSRAGVGYRELRQLRALPEDGKTALLEVAKSGDKEALLELAEDLIAKQEQEKKKLIEERDKAINQYEAREKVIESSRKQIAELQEKIARIPREKPDEKGKAMIVEVGAFAVGATKELRQLIKGAQMLLEHAQENDIDPADYKRAIEHHTADLISEIADFLSLCELSGMTSIPDRLRSAIGA